MNSMCGYWTSVNKSVTSFNPGLLLYWANSGFKFTRAYPDMCIDIHPPIYTPSTPPLTHPNKPVTPPHPIPAHSSSFTHTTEHPSCWSDPFPYSSQPNISTTSHQFIQLYNHHPPFLPGWHACLTCTGALTSVHGSILSVSCSNTTERLRHCFPLYSNKGRPPLSSSFQTSPRKSSHHA